jgi:hypothetical protein
MFGHSFINNFNGFHGNIAVNHLKKHFICIEHWGINDQTNAISQVTLASETKVGLSIFSIDILQKIL